MNMKATIFCNAGVTAGTLLHAIKKVNPEDIEFDSYDFGELEDKAPCTDVVLIAPQLRYRQDVVKKVCEPLGIPYGFIDPIAVGRLDANRVIEQARSLYQTKK